VAHRSAQARRQAAPQLWRPPAGARDAARPSPGAGRPAADEFAGRQLPAVRQRLVSATGRPLFLSSDAVAAGRAARPGRRPAPRRTAADQRRRALSRHLRLHPADRRHRPDGRPLAGTRAQRGASGRRNAETAHLFPGRARRRARPGRRLPGRQRPLYRTLQQRDRRLPVQRILRRRQPAAHRLRHADADLPGRKRAAPALHPANLARPRNPAQLVGQRRLCRLPARQLVGRTDYLDGRLRLQGGRVASRRGGHAPGLAARCGGAAGSRTTRPAPVPRSDARRRCRCRLRQGSDALRHAARPPGRSRVPARHPRFLDAPAVPRRRLGRPADGLRGGRWPAARPLLRHLARPAIATGHPPGGCRTANTRRALPTAADAQPGRPAADPAPAAGSRRRRTTGDALAGDRREAHAGDAGARLPGGNRPPRPGISRLATPGAGPVAADPASLDR